MPRIAILRSTSPLRKTSTRFGVTKQRLNLDAAMQLADRFDMVLVGSAAPDDVFDHMSRNMPRQIRMKFRFYGRSFFLKQRGRREDDDGRNAGWETILAENHVSFEPIVTRTMPDRTREQIKFDWRLMEDFVGDRDVTFISGSEGQLLYSKPTKVRK